MIDNPQNYIQAFCEAGADIITVHYEATGNQTKEVLAQIKSCGIKAGLSIKPKTSPSEIEEFISIADLILVMTVEPGFGGQKFMENCAEKLPYIKQRQNPSQYLQVDGGINDITSKKCVSLGANSLVAGNYIFKSESVKNSISSLRG
jgi:ribulose-phosphate 3-epimerase